jgi:acyl dehydratase
MSSPAAVMADYQVEAYNTAKDSENKIHDDTVARKYGFNGGLVPGVDVYAYMTHPAVQRWGRDWLTRGTGSCRLIKPVYEGATATISVQAIAGEEEAMAITVESAGQICAAGTARLPGTAPDAPDLADFPIAALPDDRPPASPASLPIGAMLGTYTRHCSAEIETDYQADVREDLPLYAAERIIHPGHLLRFGNWAVTQNVVLGPWIHVSSEVQHFATAQHGEDLSVRARITDNFERKGHLFVQLDALVLAQDSRLLARIDHTAIYQPRQVQE